MATAAGRLAADTVRYCLYPLIRKPDSSSPAQSSSSSSEQLSMYVIESLAKLNPLLSGYIWQNEPFSLHIQDQHPDAEAFIEGQTNFGDNVEDEWFIVFLLKQLTKYDADLVVTLEDSDGQFLLIEAADHLPKWLTPESSVNRVFLFQSRLHLVPKRKEPLPHGTPSLTDALSVVRSTRYETKASREIQAAIESRISGYPADIRKHQHVCRSYVPAAVAALLDADPSLVSASVRAFCFRDSLDRKACQVMKHFPPENRVLRNVRMTRCLYAQLASQSYTPDPKVGWDIPEPGTRLHKSHDLGMKLACGFEILAVAAQSKRDKNLEDDIIALLDDPKRLDQDKRWRKYIRTLYKNGYLEGLTKGSNAYVTRVNKARTYFCQTVVPSITAHIDPASYTFVGKRILHLLSSLSIDYTRYQKEESQLPAEDSDKWMRVEPEDLDLFLKEKFLDPTNTHLSKLSQSVPKAISEFVAMESGFKGVDVVKRSSSLKNKEPNSSQRAVSPTKSDFFDPESFTSALKNVLTLKVPSDPEFSDSDMSEYSDEHDSESDTSSDERNDELHFLKNQKNRNQSVKPKLDLKMKSYMSQMDKELSETTVGQTFEKIPPLASIDDEEDFDSDADVEYNALKNILHSYRSEEGRPGPSGTILNSMGIFLPTNGSDHLSK